MSLKSSLPSLHLKSLCFVSFCLVLVASLAVLSFHAAGYSFSRGSFTQTSSFISLDNALRDKDRLKDLFPHYASMHELESNVKGSFGASLVLLLQHGARQLLSLAPWRTMHDSIPSEYYARLKPLTAGFFNTPLSSSTRSTKVPPSDHRLFLVHLDPSHVNAYHTKHLPMLGRNLFLMDHDTLSRVCSLHEADSSQCLVDEWTVFDKAQVFSQHLTGDPQSPAPSDISLAHDKFIVKYFRFNSDIEQIIDQHQLQTHGNNIIVDAKDHKLNWVILNKLAKVHSVYSIDMSLSSMNKLQNYAANKIIQHGHWMNKHPDAQPLNHTYLWNHGVTGKNQIVSLGDTGIDFDHCAFSRSLNDSSLEPNTLDLTHRKIIYYQRMKLSDGRNVYESDFKDSVSGHGTHTAGSIAGSFLSNHPNYDELYQHNGVSPDARIYFQDIYNSKYPFLLIPSPLNDYFSKPYEGNARIHSNSWGCDFSSQFKCSMDCRCVWAPQNTQQKQAGAPVSDDFCYQWFGRRCCSLCSVYDDQSSEVDKFLNNHDEMAIFFAAGNLGSASLKGNVVTPSTSKNAISVGASMSLNDQFIRSIEYTDFKSIMQQIREITGGQLNFKSTKECCSYSGAQSDTVHQLCCPETIQSIYESNPDIYSSNNLASFSGRGPVPSDGRYGVDVIAPGMPVISMHSDGDTSTFNCGTMRPALGNTAALMDNQGTSMSCPLAAGSGALIRDYYQSGFYPSGKSNEKDTIQDLSGMLVKATLIHSAQPMEKGRVFLANNAYQLDQQYPNPQTGFGQVQLDSVLKFDESNFDMFVVNRRKISQGDRQSFCFSPKSSDTKSSNAEFRATLVWYDLEGTTSKGVALRNDLELNAWKKDKSGQAYFPGNNNRNHDTVNTVEQVRIPMDGQDPESIIVTVEGIAQADAEEYALVITHSKHLTMKEGCEAPERPASPIDWKSIGFFVLVIGGGALIALLSLLGLSCVAISLGKRWWASRQSAPNDDESHVELQDQGDE